MPRNLLRKFILIAAIVLVSIFGIIGVPTSGAAIRRYLEQNIRLGLDLKGGTHLVLQVMVNDAVNAESDQTAERLKNTLRQRQIEYAAMTRIDAREVLDTGGIRVEGIPTEQTSTFRQVIEETEPGWALATAEGGAYQMTLRATALAEVRNRTVQQALETLRNRIDSLGVSEPTIQERGQGDYEILVQLPGVDDPQRVKEIMQTTALLEIREVTGGPYSSRADALAAHSGVLPPGTEILESVEPREAPATPGQQDWYLVTRLSAITGRDLRSARPGRDENNRPQVDFTLSADGARRFGDFTERSIGKMLAVVLDGRIQSVATIQSRISDSGRITGRFSQQRANDLALVLRAGALPASMRYLEERTVGPSLGLDSIRAGVLVSLIGLSFTMLFMVFYYRWSGMNAVIALLLNMVILIAAMVYIRATLTLPGIAGVILTVGMAVDANILIFERIREEMRAGKTVASSVDAGFQKAFLTIMDTHVTTLVSAFFLFLFGTGPVKGFAVTLTLGLVANLFTAVFVSRAIFDYSLARHPRQATLSI